MKKPEQRSLNRAALALFFKLMIVLQKIFADLTQKEALFCRHSSSRDRRNFLTGRANIIFRSTIAADIAVTHRGYRAELNRNSNANVLRNGKEAGTILYAAAYFASRNNNRRTTTLGSGSTACANGVTVTGTQIEAD